MRGIKEAQRLGVSVDPFVSVHLVDNRYVARYGIPPGTDDYTFHPELIPESGPYYDIRWGGRVISDDNKLWQQDVLASLTSWIDRGIYSFCWDQFSYRLSEKPALVGLLEKVRDLARAKDPESTLGGESETSLEFDNEILDYTWDWMDYVDAGPIISVLRSPRLNCNVEDSLLVVRKCFAEGLYINVWTSKQDQPNGTALIAERPMLSEALKQVAALRNEFLPYFVDGTALGDSVLMEPSGAFVRGYQNGNRLLIIALNDSTQAQNVVVQSDLGLWLPSTKSYVVTNYDSQGRPLGTTNEEGSRWSGVTQSLQPLEMAFFEIKSE